MKNRVKGINISRTGTDHSLQMKTKLSLRTGDWYEA